MDQGHHAVAPPSKLLGHRLRVHGLPWGEVQDGGLEAVEGGHLGHPLGEGPVHQDQHRAPVQVGEPRFHAQAPRTRQDGQQGPLAGVKKPSQAFLDGAVDLEHLGVQVPPHGAEEGPLHALGNGGGSWGEQEHPEPP